MDEVVVLVVCSDGGEVRCVRWAGVVLPLVYISMLMICFTLVGWISSGLKC